MNNGFGNRGIKKHKKTGTKYKTAINVNMHTHTHTSNAGEPAEMSDTKRTENTMHSTRVHSKT